MMKSVLVRGNPLILGTLPRFWILDKFVKVLDWVIIEFTIGTLARKLVNMWMAYENLQKNVINSSHHQ